jgi:hypothetical protein
MNITTRYLWVFFLLFTANIAMAEDVLPVVTFACSPDEDVIKIKNEVKWGEEAKAIKFSDEKGIYNPWDWVSHDANGNYVDTKVIELDCQLSNNNYKVLLKPKLFATNSSDKCGNKVSVTVSVVSGDSILLDRKDFEAFCHGNAPIIRGIKVSGKTGEIKIYQVPKYKFY